MHCKRQELRAWCIAGLISGLGACATFVPQPLDTRVHAFPGVSGIPVQTDAMPLPELRAHRFDPRDGLDIDEVAMLAVANNPDLRVARDEAGIARAQAFAAGLLPDPQLDLSGDHPTGNVEGSNSNAFGLGISYDINALLRHSAEKTSAVAAQEEAELELLWKEWQAVAQARLSFVQIALAERSLRVLEDERALFVDRQARLRRAYDAGNITVDSVATDLAALNDVQQKLADQQRGLLKARHGLNALLGIAADAQLVLVDSDAMIAVDAPRLRALLPVLAQRRPDLRALEAGYRSQEQKYRAAVLAQFPALSIGFNRARDTSGIYTTGFSLSLSLPIFNGNRGNIAIEKATRQRLYDEYQARLTTATGEIDAILDDRVLAERQLREVHASIADLSRLSAHSIAAYQAGNIDVINYVTQRDALLSKQLEALTLEQALLEQQVSVQTLMGTSLPTTDTGTKPQ